MLNWRRIYHSCLIAIFIVLTGCASQQLQLGANAYKQGKYDQAAYHWNPLAKNGNPYAQYNLGLLWESGLGSTPKNTNEASKWYLKSAKQGYVPAMVRLANIQKANGYNEAATSWYVLAARWGNQDAISALSAWGKSIPRADLLQQKQARDAIAKQQASEEFGKAAYSLGCALAGGSCAGGQPQPSITSYSPILRSYPETNTDNSMRPKDPCNCKGYDGPGGPCYSGPGGPAYDGPGGPAYSGPGGPCYAGPGGSEYSGPGGPAYDGPGGPRYAGPGGPSYDGPGGPAYDGPGGPCYAGPGGPCYSGPGGTGQNCPSVCR